MPSVLSSPRSRRAPWYERFALLCIVAICVLLWVALTAVAVLIFVYL